MMVTLPPKPRNLAPLAALAVGVGFVAAVRGLDLRFGDLLSCWPDLLDYAAEYTTPRLDGMADVPRLMAQTVAVAWWGTLLAMLLGAISGPLSSAALNPWPALRFLVRQGQGFLRALPDLLLTLVLVIALGLGPVPGVLAIGLHTGGFLGKFFGEALDAVDRGVYEGVAATGATRLQLLMLAGWPSVMREVIGYSLYVLDRNVRMACVLGIAGGGGIGVLLQESLRLFRYDRAAYLMVVIVLCLVAIDALSTWLRKRLS